MNIWQTLTDLDTRPDQIEEMRKKFKGTYLLVNKTTLCRYIGFDAGFHLFEDTNGMTLKLAETTKYSVDIVYPKKGWYNTQKEAVYFLRNPARQYRYGANSENCFIFTFNNLLNGATHNRFNNFIVDVLSTRSYDTDVSQALSGKRSAAIDRNWAVCRSPTDKSDRLALFYHDCYVGRLVEKEKTILVQNHPFQQELLDSDWTKQWKIELH